ncbi:hypothetical protein ACHAQD_008550 [Fusarium lateritium]
MDPVSAVGLGSGILTFVEAGLKLVRIAHGIHTSVDGVLDENRHREDIFLELKQAAIRLETTATPGLTPEQNSLCDLAKKCRETSTELVTVLDKVKPKPSPSNPLKSFRYALKASKRANQIEGLESRLKDYRDQLTLALVELSKVEATDEFKNVLSLVKDNETKLESLTQAVEHIRQAHLSVTSTQAYANFQQLLTDDSQARCAIYQERILNSLKFNEMYLRYEKVHIAHEDTFNWIYEPFGPVQDGNSSCSSEFYKNIWTRQQTIKMQCESRDKFKGWLSSTTPLSPIFHISGKLGSGKSTLMKFLCCHSRTVKELEKWAGTRRLVFASFFFWRNGTKAEKSLAGLYRSILYDILKECPDLIPGTFPEHWAKAKQAPWMTNNKLEIPTALIKDALNRLLQNPQLYDKHCFCLLIDGLDEFEPGLQDDLDYLDLVKILRQWTVHANGSLKLCVTSREEGVFMDEYSNDPSFRLQDLTKFDMEDYVRSRLEDLKNETIRAKFMHLIPEKSSGIFLWTYLVVKTIRNKMKHRVSDKVLEEYLETLPDDVNRLFKHVLNNLEPNDRIWTLRTISLLQSANSKDLQLTLLASSLLEEYDNDSEFSMGDGVHLLEKDQEILRAQLRGACGGLIEYHPNYTVFGLDVLDFVHRSVPEMFKGDTKTNVLSLQMEEALNRMDAVDALIHLSFAVVRIKQVGNSLILMDKLVTIVLTLLAEKKNRPSYYFLDFIDTWIGKTWNNDTLLDTPGLTWHIEVDETYLHGMQLLSHDYESRESFFHTIMIAAATDRNDYIEWKIQNDPTTTRTALRRALVGCYLLRSRHWELFFRNDIFSLDSAVPLLPTHSTCERQQDTANFNSLTAWQFFLVSALLSEANQWTSQAFVFTDEVIEQFLKQGADPYCMIRVAVCEDHQVTLTIVFRRVQSHHCWKLTEGSETVFSGPLQWAIDRCQELRGRPRLDFSTELREEYPLREVVAGSDWANRDAILQLVDSYSENQTQT